MRQDHINYLAVGSFALAALALLLWAMLRISGTQAEMDRYYVSFPNITGIQVGSTVTFKGYQVGRVAHIEPTRRDTTTVFRLDLDISKGWPIPADSTARITAAGLLTENQIDIVEGQSTALLTPGATILDRDAAHVMARLDEVATDFHALAAEQLKPMLTKMDGYIDAVGADLAHKVPNITDTLQTLLSRFDTTVAQLEQLTDERNRKAVERSLQNVDTITTQLADVTRNLSVVNERLIGVLAQSELLLQENRSDVRHATAQLRSTIDNLAVHVDGVLVNLESASRNADELTRNLRHNPGILLSGDAPQEAGLAR